ncbi:MAG: hypothetical protein M1326_09645 [Cyanobacteria bacterium]|nr:hypothetical protein [Cyanobacteriota bacterium]
MTALNNEIKAQSGKKINTQTAQELANEITLIVQEFEQIVNENKTKETNNIITNLQISKILLLPNPITKQNPQKEKVKLLVDTTSFINSAKIEIYNTSGKK